MPTYYNYLTLDLEDISTAQAFYLIQLDTDKYRFCAIPNALNMLSMDPYVRATEYWPITRKQVSNADPNTLFPNDEIRNTPLTLQEVESVFHFQLSTIAKKKFGESTNQLGFFQQPQAVQYEPAIQAVIQQATQLGITARSINDIITNPLCLEAIREGVFTLEDLHNLEVHAPADARSDAIRFSTYPESIMAIRSHIFTIANLQGLGYSTLNQITRADCINLIARSIFTFQYLAALSGSQIKALITPECVQAIQDGIFTLAELAHLPWSESRRNAIQFVIRPACIEAIRARLFTLADLISLREAYCIDSVTQPEVIQAIQESLFTIEFLKTWPSRAIPMTRLVDSSTIQAIRNGLLTMADLTKLGSLKFLQEGFRIAFRYCIKAIQNHEFTVQDFIELQHSSDMALASILKSTACIQAIHSHLFTLQDIAILDAKKVEKIITPSCIKAIQDGVVTLKRLAEMDLAELKEMVQTGNYSTPLSKGLS